MGQLANSESATCSNAPRTAALMTLEYRFVPAEITRASYDVENYRQTMGVLARRLQDQGEDWRHVYKSLLLLEYMAKHGPQKARHPPPALERVRMLRQHLSLSYFRDPCVFAHDLSSSSFGGADAVRQQPIRGLPASLFLVRRALLAQRRSLAWKVSAGLTGSTGAVDTAAARARWCKELLVIVNAVEQ